MARKFLDAPRPIKLMVRKRREWHTGENRNSYLFTVPPHIAEQIDVDTAFYVVAMKDGSVLFKRWNPDDFNRWLAELPEEGQDE